MRNEIQKDLFRYTGKSGLRDFCSQMRRDKGFAFLVYWRYLKKGSNPILRIFSKIRIHKIGMIQGIEIPKSVVLGSGAKFIHPYNITINSKAVIGKNLTMLKGATIGNTKGNNSGVPRIGNSVYIGLNATVVGGIIIGDDVLIAANTFVNFNVPSHSVVIGNPGVIHHKKRATDKYIDNLIEIEED